MTEQVRIRFEKEPDQRITAQPIVKKPIRTKTVERKFYNKVINIPVEKVVHVPTPVVARVPVFLGT